MIVCQFYIRDIAAFKSENYSPIPVHPYRPITRPLTTQRVEAIAGLINIPGSGRTVEQGKYPSHSFDIFDR